MHTPEDSQLGKTSAYADQYDPSGQIRTRIKAVAQLWSDAALGGINFDWSNQMSYDADVRISLIPDGTFWSLVGTDRLTRLRWIASTIAWS